MTEPRPPIYPGEWLSESPWKYRQRTPMENDHKALLAQNVRLQAELARKDAALREAIDLRVKLFRHSDPEGDTDNLTDEQVAKMDRYARNWLAALEPRKEGGE